MKKISISGARVHNLKNVSLDIPKDQLIVFTGLSGSGKSSLAFDTIYAEGQRRYVESLSSYARQFLEQLDKPDVDSLDGLSPAISIDQKNVSHNPRSTVGTVTEILDYCRLLYASIGTLHCPVSGKPVRKQSSQDMLNELKTWHSNDTLLVLAPLVKKKTGEFHGLFNELRRKGFVRVRVDGDIQRLDDCHRLAKQTPHTIELVVDRVTNNDDGHSRLFEAIELALAEGSGVITLETADAKDSITMSEFFMSDHYQFSVTELTPQLFSFNSPIGACTHCNGLGEMMVFDPDYLFSDWSLTIDEACCPYVDLVESNYGIRFMADAQKAGLDMTVNRIMGDLTKKELAFVFYGRYGEEIDVNQPSRSRFGWKFRPKGWEGVINLLRRRYAQTESDRTKESFHRLMTTNVCTHCGGQRLNKEALSVKINGQTISDFCDLSIKDAKKCIETLPLTDYDAHVSEQLRKEILNRLSFLDAVGLHYLCLNRRTKTLSGGEHQRIRLATQIGSGLTGVLYVLDEPSIGLHQRDNDQLIHTLKKLRDLGNTVIVVEHDEDTIRMADHIVDIGPQAGRLGGTIVHNGVLKDLLINPHSITGKYLSGQYSIPCPKKRRTWSTAIHLTGASGNNLNHVNITVPLGVFVAVSGVSGSGKSTLIQHTLLKALQQTLGIYANPYPYKAITGDVHAIDRIISIDQAPIGRTPRSNPATYVGFFTAIRELFSKLPDARSNGYSPGRFSFNIKGGRCETCQGAGVVKIDMHFLTDIFVTCSTCNGLRFNQETLRVKYKGYSINDVLNMTVNQALKLFENMPGIHHKLQVLKDVGLGYIALGQSATTLSGGEAQRIKLAKELSKRSNKNTVYFLDEPTTGLHFDDINRLLQILQRLVDQGNTVIVIEHNLDVIKTADYVIDMGPDGGAGGGKLVAKGTPEQVVQSKRSVTATYLNRLLGTPNPV